MNQSDTPLCKARAFLKRARIVIWICAALATVYLMFRFEVIALPENSCSPLHSIPAGTKMWVDRYSSGGEIGDVVLYRDPDIDQVLIGRIVVWPSALPNTELQKLNNGAFWLEGDNESCPQRDSRLFGAVSADRIVGRMMYSW